MGVVADDPVSGTGSHRNPIEHVGDLVSLAEYGTSDQVVVAHDENAYLPGLGMSHVAAGRAHTEVIVLNDGVVTVDQELDVRVSGKQIPLFREQTPDDIVAPHRQRTGGRAANRRPGGVRAEEVTFDRASRAIGPDGPIGGGSTTGPAPKHETFEIENSGCDEQVLRYVVLHCDRRHRGPLVAVGSRSGRPVDRQVAGYQQDRSGRDGAGDTEVDRVGARVGVRLLDGGP